MSDETKHVWDVALALVGMIGAAIAFLKAIHEWRESQRWRRSEQLDKLVEKFETTPLLRLACTVIDWTNRRVTHEQRDVRITNRDALLALRDHEEGVTTFDGEQPLIRDAYDALLGFFVRLNVAIETRLVDEAPARTYFRYWLEKFVAMDKHRVPKEKPNSQDHSEQKDRLAILEWFGDRQPEQMVAAYVKAYSDPEIIEQLCTKLKTKLATPGTKPSVRTDAQAISVEGSTADEGLQE